MTVTDAKKWFRIYYSQNREDLILWAFFSDQKDGFYVDVGAHDSEIFSVTKLFYDQGWHGINVEPQKQYCDKLQKDRPRDTNLNIALSDKKAELMLREYPQADGLSTLSEEMKGSYLDDTHLKGVTDQYREYAVKVDTLKNVLQKYAKGKQINFLKIDVEGLEEQVLKGNDWKQFRPQVICIEANHVFRDWSGILRKAHYKEYFNDGLNEYYIAEECYETLSKKFDYAGKILNQLSVQSIPFTMFIDEISKLTQDNKKLNAFVTKQDTRIKVLDAHIAKIESEISDYSRMIINTARIKHILAKLIGRQST